MKYIFLIFRKVDILVILKVLLGFKFVNCRLVVDMYILFYCVILLIYISIKKE